MNRGEVWWGEVGGKRRPVVILTRPEVIDVRELVTVAEFTTTSGVWLPKCRLMRSKLVLPNRRW